MPIPIPIPISIPIPIPIPHGQQAWGQSLANRCARHTAGGRTLLPPPAGAAHPMRLVRGVFVLVPGGPAEPEAEAEVEMEDEAGTGAGAGRVAVGLAAAAEAALNSCLGQAGACPGGSPGHRVGPPGDSYPPPDAGCALTVPRPSQALHPRGCLRWGGHRTGGRPPGATRSPWRPSRTAGRRKVWHGSAQG